MVAFQAAKAEAFATKGAAEQAERDRRVAAAETERKATIAGFATMFPAIEDDALHGAFSALHGDVRSNYPCRGLILFGWLRVSKSRLGGLVIRRACSLNFARSLICLKANLMEKFLRKKHGIGQASSRTRNRTCTRLGPA